MPIRKAKDAINDAVKRLLGLQSGKFVPIRTRFAFINDSTFDGFLMGMIVLIAGISGSGKTYFLQQLEDDIFNDELNPHNDDIVLLRCNWEMGVFRLLLRKLKNGLNKTIKDILFFEPDVEEKAKYKRLTDEERNENIYYLDEPMSPDDWYEEVRNFILGQKAIGKKCVVTLDHLGLTKDGGNKKKAVDDLIERANRLKIEFEEHVMFILLSQLNRNIEGRTELHQMAPQRGDIYGTDTAFHISDLIIVKHIPYNMGYEEYMFVEGCKEKAVDDVRYGYLSQYMKKAGNKRTSFHTKNLAFYHFLKMREKDEVSPPDLFIDVINPNGECYDGSDESFDVQEDDGRIDGSLFR